VVIATTTLPGWLPDFDGTIVGGELLRGWALSEVWRIHLDGVTRTSVIAKRGIGELAGEARRYHELVEPLGITAPRLLAEGVSGVIVLEDLGGDNLEDRPTADGYEQAVRVLAGCVPSRRCAWPATRRWPPVCAGPPPISWPWRRGPSRR
jgi:hypothetical protein